VFPSKLVYLYDVDAHNLQKQSLSGALFARFPKIRKKNFK